MSVSLLLEKNSLEEVRKKVSNLEPALQDLLSESVGGNLIESIFRKYQVDPDWLPEIMMLLGFYLTRTISSQEFVNELFVFIPDEYFNFFLKELEDKLWSPYDVYLNKAGVVYKQLTKLTPQKPADGEEQTVSPTVQQPITPPSIPITSQAVDLPKPFVSQPATQLPVITELPKVAEVSEQIVDNQSPITVPKPIVISDLSAPGVKTAQEIPISDTRHQVGEARVKFDEPRVGPKIEKSTASGFTPKIQEVKFEGPEIKPEVLSQVPPASAQWQRPEEKKVQIPKPPEVGKTEVDGRQVIDLTNFGLSKPDKD